MGNLISTFTSAKTGTVVKKMLAYNGKLRKTIQYGEKTPLGKIGIDTVDIILGKNGKKTCSFFSQNGGRHLFTFGNGEYGLGDSIFRSGTESLVDGSSFPKTVKNFIDALRASKAMMG